MRSMKPVALIGLALAALGCAGAEKDTSDFGVTYDFARVGGNDGFGAGDLGPGDGGGGDLSAPPVLMDLLPPTTTIAAGKSFSVSALFSGKNLGAPITVTFMSSDPAIVSVTGSALLAFNANTVSAMVAALTVGDATITASQGGIDKTCTVHVVPSVMSLMASPLKIQVGQTGTLAITLSSPALQGGADVTMMSADPTVATVPPTVNVPEGTITATVTVTAVGIGQAAITAGYASSMQTAQAMVIDPATRLVLSEVLYDALGADDGYEWVELYNGGNAPIDLSGYFLGTTASSMSVAYMAATPALTGTLQPGDCKVVGGPTADPNANALPANFTFLDAVKFNPNLPNGTVTTAEAVGLYQGAPNNIGGAKLVDAVIYGTAQRGISDETGGTTRLDVGYVKFPAQTLERYGQSVWRVQNTPTGGACDWLHL